MKNYQHCALCATICPMISLIYARSLDHCIGDNGHVPWYLPDDYSHFENTTLGKPIIMGRRTYEDHRSVLSGCLNIVISSQLNYLTVEGVELVHSLADAIDLANNNSDDVFVIGGVTVFSAVLTIASNVYETVVETELAGDTVLPNMDFGDWESELLQDHPIDDRHEFAFKIYRHCR
jgi:dihydrofolate reductase